MPHGRKRGGEKNVQYHFRDPERKQAVQSDTAEKDVTKRRCGIMSHMKFSRCCEATLN